MDRLLCCTDMMMRRVRLEHYNGITGGPQST
jgi:hypothetical protein